MNMRQSRSMVDRRGTRGSRHAAAGEFAIIALFGLAGLLLSFGAEVLVPEALTAGQVTMIVSP